MPLYEYRCQKCEHEFEVLVSSRNREEPTCPECGAPGPDQLIGLPAAGRASGPNAANCRGDGPPCGAPWCGRTS